MKTGTRDFDMMTTFVRTPKFVVAASAFALLFAVAGSPSRSWAQSGTPAAGVEAERRAAPSSGVPAAPNAILYARPFVSEQPIEFVVGGEKVTRTKGWILVVEAEKTFLEPKDAPDFVLFAGDAIARKVSSGCWSGKVVVMAPEVDLEAVPVFFGSRLLPDRLTAEDVRAEIAAAKALGIGARPRRELRDAARKGGDEPFRVRDMDELWHATGPVILEHSPEEREMVESLRKN